MSARTQIGGLYEQWLSTQYSFVHYRTSSTDSVLIDITDPVGQWIGVIV